MLKAREVVNNLHAYRPPLAGRTGLRLDFNESTVGCSPRVLARLRSLDTELLARYPEREPVEKEVADFLGLDPAQVLLTNGVDEAIHLLSSTYLDPGDEALIVTPTFAMYAIFARAEGARVVEVRAADNFAFPTQDLLAQLSPRTRLIAVANPNNPTGAAVAGTALIQVAQAAPQAALASKINTYLSGPMLWGMVAGSHVNIWDMNIGTLIVALILGLGLIHGLYATSRKVKTTV